MDWGDGAYELTAAELEPVSEVVVAAARLQRGERVLDVACGTGNAALAAAALGAEVAGLDASERLIEVARDRARLAGVEAEWTAGDAGDLPFAPDAFDAALSVFGVIFAPDAAQAVSELERVVRPGGRIVVTAWLDRGPLAAVMRASRAAVVPHLPTPPDAGDHLEWGDAAAVAKLFAGSAVEAEERSHAFTGASPRAWVEQQFAHHPAWRGMNGMLPAASVAELQAQLAGILADANQDTGALRVSSPYVVYRADVRPAPI